MKDTNGKIIEGSDVISYAGMVYYPDDKEDSMYMKQYSNGDKHLILLEGSMWNDSSTPSVSMYSKSEVFLISSKVTILSKEDNPEWYI